ncbi:hypothetical protein CB1_000724008 [Camelus ferus]|nr:hypothetical protein CB1_000724008 [Camelus ferus]
MEDYNEDYCPESYHGNGVTQQCQQCIFLENPEVFKICEFRLWLFNRSVPPGAAPSLNPSNCRSSLLSGLSQTGSGHLDTRLFGARSIWSYGPLLVSLGHPLPTCVIVPPVLCFP